MTHLSTAPARVHDLRFAPFQRWASLPNLAVLHTQTTGIRGEVIEVAVVDAQGKTLFSERIRPCGLIEPGAQQYHGVCDDDLAGLPQLDHHWPGLGELLGTRPVIAYNNDFQVQVLLRSLDSVMPRDWEYEHPEGEEARWRALYQPMHIYLTSSSCVMEAYTPIYDNRGGFGGMLKPAKFPVALEREGVYVDDLPPIYTALGSALRTLRLVQAVAARGGTS
ncbi:3'-5' exonuclease [Deinococcus ruber]|uniref:DNA polymerase III subunit epsilon n=1 Tax=Deinococcus ruber TaxID=1848197 RepID=A0A918F8L7_9DEIO|nr:hypothetical protein [Deinococcus ruber]GGR11558.1 hypothetical protein GCM10008957_25640 [Deinococcus ruber]